MPLDARLQEVVAALGGRALPTGAFAARVGEEACPESTAWAILGLTAAGVEPERVARARAWLRTRQGADGRVAVAPDEPTVPWVTPLAALAWHGAPEHRKAEARAADYLIASGGKTYPRSATSAIGHDTSLQGWAWNEGTHSMVEPTALGLLALRMAGRGGHARAREAERVLVDRQLPHGGWNYGNTFVYGTELRPQPHTTGLALLALAGHVNQLDVAGSLALLRTETARLRSPLSLGYGLLALGAYGERPTTADAWLAEAAALQARRGAYDTPLLALLTLAALGDRGVSRLLA